MRLLVALLAQRQSFFFDDRQRLMQRIEEGCRSGVMITVRDRQVILNQGQVKVPAAVRLLALAEPLLRPRRDRNRAQSGRRAEPLLRAAISDVDAVGVHIHGHGTERGNAIGDDDGVHFVRGVAERLALLKDTGRGFRLHEGHNLRTLAADKLGRPHRR